MIPKSALSLRLRPLTRVLAGFAVVSLAIVTWLACVQYGSNFHVVEAGQFYRAGRISPENLARVVQQYGIRSVLNLEGARPEKSWYRAEVAELDRLHVARFDYRLSATRITPPQQVDELLNLIRSAPKPMLVHCRTGSDRTGLVAALYLAKIRNHDEDEAYEQLSLAYGHFQYLGSGTEEMDDTYWANVDPVGHPD